jgi:hypothetical protein
MAPVAFVHLTLNPILNMSRNICHVSCETIPNPLTWEGKTPAEPRWILLVAGRLARRLALPNSFHSSPSFKAVIARFQAACGRLALGV